MFTQTLTKLNHNGATLITLESIASAVELSKTIIQKEAVRSQVLVIQPEPSVLDDNLLILLTGLRKRYPKNTKLIELMPPEYDQQLGEALKQQKELASTKAEEAMSQPAYSQSDFNQIPPDIREFTVHAMREPAWNLLMFLQDTAEELGLGKLWLCFVYKLHVEQGYYPKLAVRTRGVRKGWVGELGKLLGTHPLAFYKTT